ncbi:hypothetical protein [Spiroplasma endosymbiont of Polydrusus formosus]|uniref:hypothetical protein n=1 Tax=Spiroplasma endosymbiont of Polydrusus formosus TaxID=3139326 RepID=UPI0035B52BF5
MGIPVPKSFNLEKTYTKRQVNRDKGYNFTNINGLLINKQVWTYSININAIQQVLNNDIVNPKWIFGEVCNLQHQLFYIQKYVKLF